MARETLAAKLGFEEEILAESSVNPGDAEAEATINIASLTSQAEEVARTSMDFLAGLAMPSVFKYFFPPVFVSIWMWLISYVHKVRDFSQLAIGLPRGFGKTMVIKLFILYSILFTKKQFILIIAGTQSKANNILADIIGMLNESNILKIFGDWRLGIITDRQELKRFTFRGRVVILMGAGAQSDIRGITLENARPDVMIFDDIQTREDADSEVVSNGLEQWMYGTAMKAKSPEGCLFIFIANMYPTKWSLLRRLKTNPNWIKFIAGGILADGTSLWEDLQPKAQLLREFQNDLSAGRPEVFFAEVLNDENASVNNFLDISKLPVNPYGRDEIHQGNWVMIDPATDKAKADAVSIGYFELFDEKPLMREVLEDSLSPGAIAEQAIRMCLRNGCFLIVVEANAFQYVLKWIIEQALAKYQIVGINVVPIYSGSTSKNARILKMFKTLMAGECLLDERVKAQVTSQAVAFNPLKTNNTDGILDLLTYAPRIPQEFGEFILQSTVMNMQESDAVEIPLEIECSPF